MVLASLFWCHYQVGSAEVPPTSGVAFQHVCGHLESSGMLLDVHEVHYSAQVASVD